MHRLPTSILKFDYAVDTENAIGPKHLNINRPKAVQNFDTFANRLVKSRDDASHDEVAVAHSPEDNFSIRLKHHAERI